MLCMELLIPYMLLIQYMGVREAGYKLLSPGVVRQLKAGAWGGMGARWETGAHRGIAAQPGGNKQYLSVSRFAACSQSPHADRSCLYEQLMGFRWPWRSQDRLTSEEANGNPRED